MSEQRPSFPLYARDWYIGTRSLSPAARAAHIDLMSVAWIDGGLPHGPDTLRLIVGMDKPEWRKVWPELEPKWPINADGQRRNGKLEAVRAEVEAYSEAKRRAGQKGGKASASRRAHIKQEPSTTEAGEEAGSKPASASALASEKQVPSLPSGRVSVSLTDAQGFVDAWNRLTTAPLPRCRELTKARREAIRRRLSERPLAEWETAMRKVDASEFCNGGSEGTGWKADIDWLIRNSDNVVKVLEGRYDDAPGEDAGAVPDYNPQTRPIEGW